MRSIQSKQIIAFIIFLALVSLIFRLWGKEQQSEYPSIYEYLKCVNTKCSKQECSFKDFECEKAFSEFKQCQKLSPDCIEWEEEIQKDVHDVQISESFFKCKKSCAPKKSTSGEFYTIFKCDELCAQKGLQDHHF